MTGAIGRVVGVALSAAVAWGVTGCNDEEPAPPPQPSSSASTASATTVTETEDEGTPVAEQCGEYEGLTVTASMRRNDPCSAAEGVLAGYGTALARAGGDLPAGPTGWTALTVQAVNGEWECSGDTELVCASTADSDEWVRVGAS